MKTESELYVCMQGYYSIRTAEQLKKLSYVHLSLSGPGLCITIANKLSATRNRQ